VFCNNCGHRNPSGSNFCSSCGAPLEHGGDDTTITLVPVESAGEVGDDEITVGFEGLADGLGMLDSDVTRAGRHPESDIFLDDITVSRRHAEFERKPDGYAVRDVGSLNGTYLNRERIDEAKLTNGDEVQIGKFKLVFLTGGEG
jgi:pSer/pThr/pTyr-binding forkhead associated (FHA) protein